MRVDIHPQWQKISSWYWEECNEAHGRSAEPVNIWELLYRDYGARKLFGFHHDVKDPGMWMGFPDEKSYVAFLLRWS